MEQFGQRGQFVGCPLPHLQLLRQELRPCFKVQVLLHSFRLKYSNCSIMNVSAVIFYYNHSISILLTNLSLWNKFFLPAKLYRPRWTEWRIHRAGYSNSRSRTTLKGAHVNVITAPSWSDFSAAWWPSPGMDAHTRRVSGVVTSSGPPLQHQCIHNSTRQATCVVSVAMLTAGR